MADARAAVATSDGDVVAGGEIEGDSGTQFAVVRFAASDGTERWRALLPEAGESTVVEPARVNAVAVDGDGAIVAAGRAGGGTAQTFTVVKLVGATGAVSWRFDLAAAPADGSADAEAWSLVLDEAGDAFAAGVASDPMGMRAFTIVKLAHDTGAPLWTVQHPYQRAVAIAALPGGDLVVVEDDQRDSVLHPTTIVPKRAVLRLDGTTGGESWRTNLDPDGGWLRADIAVTPVGVFVGGTFTPNPPSPPGPNPPPETVAQLVRIGVADGAPGWSQSLATLATVLARPDADLVVLRPEVGPAPDRATLALQASIVRGEDGSLRATSEISPGSADRFAAVHGATVAPAGDLIVTGELPLPPQFFQPPATEAIVVRLASADLGEVWRRVTPTFGDPIGNFVAATPDVTASGRVYVPGAITTRALSPLYSGVPIVFSVVALDLVDGAPRICGDGMVDAGEACDDHNTADGDCCSSDCRTVAPDGTACDDANACTIGDVCASGTCRGPEPLPCAPCGVCYPSAGCFVDGGYECRRATTSDAAMLAFVERRHGGHAIEWRMRDGPETTLAQLGDPRTSSPFALCAYDSGNRVIVRATAPAGRCGHGRSCWHRTRRGFEYENPRAPDGISRLSLRAGAAGRTRLRVAGRGRALSLPTLPLADRDVTVELRRLDDAAVCWTATHTNVTRNDVTRFRASGD